MSPDPRHLILPAILLPGTHHVITSSESAVDHAVTAVTARIVETMNMHGPPKEPPGFGTAWNPPTTGATFLRP